MKLSVRFLLVFISFLCLSWRGYGQGFNSTMYGATLAYLTQVGHNVVCESDPLSGKKVYVWMQHDAGGWTRDIYCAIYDKDMNPITGSFLVNNVSTSDNYDQGDHALKIVSYDGSFVVTWGGETSGNYDIYAKKISLNITAADALTIKSQADLKVNSTLLNGSQSFSSVTYNEKSGEVIVGFQSPDAGGTDQMYYQRLSYTGSTLTRLGTEQKINTIAIPQAIKLAYNSVTGDVIAVYHSWASGGEVMRRVISYDEVLDTYSLGTEINMASYTAGDQLDPSIVVNQTTGNYAVCWHSYNQGETGVGLYGKVYSSTHGVVKSDFNLTTYVSGDQMYPRPVWDERTNSLMVFYLSVITNPGNCILYGAVFDGNASTSYTRVNVGNGSPSATDANIVSGVYNNKFWASIDSWHNVMLGYETYPSANNSTCKGTYFSYSHPDFAKGNFTTESGVNWVGTRTFNAYKEQVGESRSYYDKMGKLLQSQSYNAESKKNVMGQMPFYDFLDRPSLQTLPAVTNTNETFSSTNVFALGTNGTVQSFSNPQLWDSPSTINNPSPVVTTPASNLSSYYVSANTIEPFTAQTSYPYSRTIYSDNAPGGVTKQTLPGDAFRPGMGKESKSITLPVINELDHYARVRRITFMNNDPYVSTMTIENASKTIVTDQNGMTSISFADKAGKTIATAKEGGSTAIACTVSVAPNLYATNIVLSDNFVSASNLQIFGNSDIQVFNQSNGNQIYPLTAGLYGSIDGFLYQYNTLVVGVTNIQIRSKEYFYSRMLLSYVSAFGAQSWINIEADYYAGQSGIDLHLQDQHSLTFSGIPTGAKIAVINLETGVEVYNGLASGYNSTALAKGYYRILYTDLATYNASYSSVSFTMTYNQKYTEFAYFYYDVAGRMVAKSAPEGLKVLTEPSPGSPAPGYTDSFIYSSTGQLLSSTEIDAGTSNFVYRKDGNIRFSQNALQAVTGKFSFVTYDEYNRGVKSGEYDKTVSGATLVFQTQKQYDASPNASSIITIMDNLPIANNGGFGSDNYLSEFAFTTYSTYGFAPGANIFDANYNIVGFRTQRNTWNRVITSTNKINYYTSYSYDNEGRVEWIVQNIPGLGSKTIDYVYDANGLLLQTIYQKNVQTERFEHINKYDNIGRLKTALSRDMNGRVKQHEKYSYDLNGSLKRKEIAGNLQGIDYVYTTQGWLKGINHHEQNTTKDPGQDNKSGSTNAGFLPDVFGMSFDYYTGDYTNSTIAYTAPGSMTNYGLGSLNSSLNGNLYNGTIRSATWQTKGDLVAGNVTEYAYTYDAKYQLIGAAYGNRNITTNNFAPASFLYDLYAQYDLNGNLTQKTQQKGSGNPSDTYTYLYAKPAIPAQPKTTNKLYVVANAATGGVLNYDYNVIGQMTKQTNADGSIMNVTYNAAGLVTEVRDNTNALKVSYQYNERGQRVKKISAALNQTTYYVLDAVGHELGIYTQTGASIPVLTDIPVYGSGRSGVVYKNGTILTYTYEIKDNLSNLRATIARNRNVNNTINLLSWSDYLPYGEVNPLRNSPSSFGTRYGYQGEYSECDAETKWNSFDLRMYDANVGRWLSVDPKGQYASPYVGMGNNPISGVDPDGGKTYPIYNIDTGVLMGTSAGGLQGEAIVMDQNSFHQNMSDEDAKSMGTFLSNMEYGTEFYKKVLFHSMSLSSRPDWDGIVTDQEARAHWQGGSGEPLYINVAKINLAPLTTHAFEGNETLRYNFFTSPRSTVTTGRVFGTLSMRLRNANTGEVGFRRDDNGFFDVYDFNGDGRVMRDATTWTARRVVGEGVPYGFIPYGSNPTVPQGQWYNHNLW